MSNLSPVPQNPIAPETTITPEMTSLRPALGQASLVVRDFSMALILLAIWGYFAVMSGGNFISSRNLSFLSVELSIIAVLALGQLLIIVTSQIDLSIGSGAGLFGAIATVLIANHWHSGAAMSVATVGAVLIWLLMGTLIVTQRMPAFIITLAGLLIFRGLHWKTINSTTVPVTIGGQENMMSALTTWFLPPLYGWILMAVVILVLGLSSWRTRQRRQQFGFTVEPSVIAFLKFFILAQVVAIFTIICNQYRGIPLSVLIHAATALAVGILTKQTPFGRYLYAIGGNEEAALVSGVPVKKVVIGTFGIMGLLVALGGFMQTAYAGGSTTTIGELLELDAIAACVIGGTSLRGGRGTVMGVIFGALIMASLVNGMNLLSIKPEDKYIARGLVLALAVWLDTRLSKP